jgi:HPt (histidine-containing phosphotransfer) domain-containing protein
MDENPIIIVDMERFRLTAETREEEQEVLPLFFILIEQKIAVLEQALTGNDKAQWKSALHYLKGAAANLGTHALAESCRKAEQSGISDAMIAGIKSELQRVRDFFAAR